MSLARFSSYYGNTAVATVCQLIFIPINLSILGLELWALLGLTAILKTVIARLDAGAQVIVQVEAAKNAYKTADRFYIEITLVSIGLCFFSFSVLYFISSYISHGNEMYQLAMKEEVAVLIVLCAFSANLIRLAEANLVGHSMEVFVNALRVTSLLLVSFSPIVLVGHFGAPVATLFKALLFINLVHLAITWGCTLFSAHNFKVLLERETFLLVTIREKLKTLLSAGAYQGAAFFSTGADIIILTYLMSKTDYAILVLIYSIKDKVNSIFRPVNNYMSQEIYKNIKVDQSYFYKTSLVMVAIFNLLFFSMIYELLPFWIPEEQLNSNRLNLYLIVACSLWFFPVSAIVARSNLNGEFSSRTASYLISGLIFYFFIFILIDENLEVELTYVATALVLREVSLILVLLLRSGVFWNVYGRFLFLLVLQVTPVYISLFYGDYVVPIVVGMVAGIIILFKGDILKIAVAARRHFLNT